MVPAIQRGVWHQLGGLEMLRRWAVTVSSYLLVILLGCAPHNPPEMIEAAPASVRWGEYRVGVNHSRSEPSSIGTYQVSVCYPSGSTIRFSGQREGSIRKVWLTDLDLDSMPELVIWMVSTGSGSYAKIDLFRLEESEPRPMPLAPLTEMQARGYMGHDQVDVEDGRLIRCFPLYDPGDSNADPSGGERCVWYSYDENRWRNSK